MKSTSSSPLGRSAASDVLDWEGVERKPTDRAVDAFGFRPEDRAALGLGPARTMDTVPHVGGDASQALIDALAKGAAVGKKPATPRRKR